MGGLLPNPYVILGVSAFFLISVIGSFFEGEHIKSLEYEAALSKQKIEADAIYATALEKTKDIEIENANLNSELEKAHADQAVTNINQQATNTTLANKLVSDFGTSVRVQFAGCRKGGSDSVPSSTAVTRKFTDTASTHDNISTAPQSGPNRFGSAAQLTQSVNNLINLAKDADDTQNALAECLAWARNVNKTLGPHTSEAGN